MKRVLLLLLALTVQAVAQQSCYFCNSQNSVRQVKFGKESHYVCYECRNKPKNCDLCYRKVQQPELLQDGRMVCSRCKATAILSQDQLEGIYDRVKGFLRTEGLLVPKPPPVKLADKDEIQTKFTASGRSMDVAGFYSPYNPEEIFILSGQSPEECASTMAHEYTHAWQSRNCPSQDRAVKEGFASWVEYHYLISAGRQGEAQSLTRKSDPDYGASLVVLLEMEKKVGKKGVIEFAKTATALPK